MSNVLSKVAAAAAVLMGVATSADAFVILSMRDLSTATTKTCNTFTLVGCGGGSGFTVVDPNNVSFAGTVGVFDTTTTIGVNNIPGLPGGATSDTTSLTVTRNDGGAGSKNLVVDFISFVFTAPVGILKNLDGSASTSSGRFTTGDLVNTTFSVDSDAGTGFVAGPTISSTSCLMAVAPSNNCDSPRVLWSDPALGVAGFSTRTQQVFQMAADSRINTTSSLTITVPEPMSVSLVGAALLGLGFASRRRNAPQA